MRGLALSEKLFRDHFMPMINKELPEAIPYFEAGLVGEGSECFGYDDDVSLDHDCDVRLCIWMDDEWIGKFGVQLQEILQKMPPEICGRKTNLMQNGKSGLLRTEDFYQHLLGRRSAPETNREWLEADETMLACSVNGKVFTKTETSFMAVREKLLDYYPEDVRLIRLARAIGLSAQAGQYNYLRMIKRNDPAAAEMSKQVFIESAVQAVFLLEKTYKPFYKWTFRKMRELKCLGKAAFPEIYRLYRLGDAEAFHAIEEISGMIIDEMRRQEISAGKSDFLMEHIPELAKRVNEQGLLANGISLVR